tara:strand:+ start:569 stop:1411 length:843 start_codon:yes stop_codon:yes gene_type:complete
MLVDNVELRAKIEAWKAGRQAVAAAAPTSRTASSSIRGGAARSGVARGGAARGGKDGAARGTARSSGSGTDGTARDSGSGTDGSDDDEEVPVYKNDRYFGAGYWYEDGRFISTKAFKAAVKAGKAAEAAKQAAKPAAKPVKPAAKPAKPVAAKPVAASKQPANASASSSPSKLTGRQLQEETLREVRSIEPPVVPVCGLHTIAHACQLLLHTGPQQWYSAQAARGHGRVSKLVLHRVMQEQKLSNGLPHVQSIPVQSGVHRRSSLWLSCDHPSKRAYQIQ